MGVPPGAIRSYTYNLREPKGLLAVRTTTPTWVATRTLGEHLRADVCGQRPDLRADLLRIGDVGRIGHLLAAGRGTRSALTTAV